MVGTGKGQVSGIWGVLVGLVVLGAVGCGGAAAGEPTPLPPTPRPFSAAIKATIEAARDVPHVTDRPAAGFPSNALGKMEIAFEGRHNKAQIKRQCDLSG